MSDAHDANFEDVKFLFLDSEPPREAIDFTKGIARDFYEGVRCGLLHEARTKNGWTILAKASGRGTIDGIRKIVYRNNFQAGLLSFVEWYKGALTSDIDFQRAFIRKFDSLCV